MSKPAQPPTPSGGDAAGSFSFPERDLVTFYSRLTHTLENACGRDALSLRLASLRSGQPKDGGVPIPTDSLARTLRRVGAIGAGVDSAAFADALVTRVGEAVSRPPEHVRFMLALFVAGDDALSLKPVCGATPQCASCLLTRECDYFNSPRKPAMTLLTPAARLASGNQNALSDAELLAVLLFGDRATGQEPLTQTLLARYGRLLAVFRAEAQEFAGIRDMSAGQALRMSAIAALYRRLLEERRGAKLHISSAQDIFDRYFPELRDYPVEAAVLLMLDQRNNVIRDAWFCEGATNMTHVSMADLLRPAIREFACRVALVHNHPSNNPAPSLADLEFTRRMRSACDVVGLGLVDHVIVAEAGYYSFAEEGMLGG